jgi:hypothetical protein
VRLALVLSSWWLVLVLCGCAAAPVQEMSNARQAIAAAEDAGAAAEEAVLMDEARALLASAETKLQRQNYIGARIDATNARLKAVEALERTQQPQ